jgi:glycosyltransferase involved in cell wall biosynthesis
LEQTYRDVEVIVSDDASTDDTLERVREIDDPRVRVFSQETRLGVVRNPDFCLRRATGEFWMFLGDDDALMPTAIERLVAPFLAQRTDGKIVGATWCPCLVVDGTNDRFWATEGGPEIEPATTMLSQLFAGNRGPRCSSVLLRTQDALTVGGYDAKYGDLSDIGNWGRAAMRGDVMVCINEPLVMYTMHQNNMTGGSSIERWQNWSRMVLADLVIIARERGDTLGERELLSARRNFVSGVTLTILISTIGKPGWMGNAVTQAMRTPGAFFSPYMFRRLIKDGRKVFTLRNRAAKP